MFNTPYKKIGLVIILTAVTYLIIRYAGLLISLVLPLSLALIISYKMHPLITALDEKCPLPRSVISLLSVLLSIAIIALVVFGIIRLAITAGMSLSAVLPKATEELTDFYQAALNSYHTYFKLIPSNWQGVAENSIQSFINQIGSFIGSFATALINRLTFLPNILLFLMFTLLTTYFVTRDFDRVNEFIQRSRAFLNEKILFKEFKKNVLIVLIGYFKAQLILMSITFVISLAGLITLKVSYAPLIALIVALVDALPMLGPAFIYIPWIIARCLVGNVAGAIPLGLLYLVATLTRQTLEPKIVSTQIGIHPIITISAMYAGIQLFGFLGIILGPLAAMTIIKSYKILTLTSKHEH